MGGCRAKKAKKKKQTLVISIYRVIRSYVAPSMSSIFYYLRCSELLS